MPIMSHLAKVNEQNEIHDFLEKNCMSPQKFACEPKVGVAKYRHFLAGILFSDIIPIGLEASSYSLYLLSNKLDLSWKPIYVVTVEGTAFIQTTILIRFAAKLLYFMLCAPLDMRGCISHYTKWHIHPFISKMTCYDEDC